MKINTHQEVLEINKTLKEVIRYEIENLKNGNETSLMRLDDYVLEYLVDYWYTCREKQIFMNDQGIEIDEYLNVEEYKF